MKTADSIVVSTANCDVHLDGHGFYVTCRACPYVSVYTAAKHIARKWAECHDNDQPGDHRAS